MANVPPARSKKVLTTSISCMSDMEYDGSDPNKRKNSRRKKTVNYYIPQEDLNYMKVNTRYSEQEIRYGSTMWKNFKIFVPLRFYVKSVLRILEVQKVPFLPFWGQ